MHLFVHIYHKNLLSNFYKHLQILSIIPSPNPEKWFIGENTSVIFVSACIYIAKISSNMIYIMCETYCEQNYVGYNINYNADCCRCLSLQSHLIHFVIISSPVLTLIQKIIYNHTCSICHIKSIYNCLKAMVSTFTVCSPYYYGIDCITPCGHCRGDDVCNNVTGHCPLGCKQHWVGSKCNGTTLIFFFLYMFSKFEKTTFLFRFQIIVHCAELY